MRKEKEPIPAPISREAFQEWVNSDRYGDLRVRQASGEVLGFHKYDILPEVYLLFTGEPEQMFATMDPCGLYDKKTQEFRFVNRTMSACVDGLSEAELWDRTRQGPNLMQLVKNYGRNAVAQDGYRVSETTIEYDAFRRTVFAGLNAMASYAGVLAARGEETALLDLRDLAFQMHPFWQDYLYQECQKAGEKLERQYHEKFDSAAALARESGQPPKFDGQKAKAILNALDVHVLEDLFENGNHFTLWQCSQLAKRLKEEYPHVTSEFGESYAPDYSERFTKFGSKDREHLNTGWLLGQDIILFCDPIPEDAVPEGWHCYHLAGRNIMNTDRLMTSMPDDYVGSVLSPCSLMDTGQRNIRPQDLFMDSGRPTLKEFCEKLHLPVPDMSGIFLDQQQATGMEGMSL